MKKKTIANLIMVVIIVGIVAAGALAVAHIRGWFDADDGTAAVLREVRGVVRLERDGVSAAVEGGTVLRAGDRLCGESGATALIDLGNGWLALGEKAALTVTEPAADRFAAELTAGEAFVHGEGCVQLRFADRQAEIAGATVHVSVRSGAASLSVLRGSVEEIRAGEKVEYVGGETAIASLEIDSLNDFAIEGIRRGNQTAALCVTDTDLEELLARRQAELQAIINSADKPESSGEAQPQDGEDGTADKPQDTPDNSHREPQSGQESEKEPEKPKQYTCTIAIYCDTILNNMDDLEPGKAEFVPAGGVILSPVEAAFTEGETVFDVLKRVCSAAGIQIEYSWTPLYDSYYIEGIHHLYEFDCGVESGWMYKVNGWFPNYGCSSYTLADGDVIVWAYTCQGLGTDVGAPGWDG